MARASRLRVDHECGDHCKRSTGAHHARVPRSTGSHSRRSAAVGGQQGVLLSLSARPGQGQKLPCSPPLRLVAGAATCTSSTRRASGAPDAARQPARRFGHLADFTLRGVLYASRSGADAPGGNGASVPKEKGRPVRGPPSSRPRPGVVVRSLWRFDVHQGPVVESLQSVPHGLQPDRSPWPAEARPVPVRLGGRVGSVAAGGEGGLRRPAA